MREHLEVISAIGLGLGLAMAFVQAAVAQQNPVTAIDIALEPDATMIRPREGRQRASAQVLSEGLFARRDAPPAHLDAAAVRPHG